MGSLVGLFPVDPLLVFFHWSDLKEYVLMGTAKQHTSKRSRKKVRHGFKANLHYTKSTALHKASVCYIST